MKITYMPLYMRRPLAFNGWSEASKHNLEIPVGTEFSELLRLTAGKQKLLSYPYSHRWRSLFSKQGGKRNHVVHGIVG
jgi:hypothetical protein